MTPMLHGRLKTILVLCAATLSACMNSPVLDGARLVAPGAWRVDTNGSFPLSREAIPEPPAHDDEAIPTRDRWQQLAFYPAFALAAHHGSPNGRNQVDVSIASNTMLGAGTKLPVFNHNAFDLALGFQIHWSILGFISDEVPAVMKFTIPFWVGVAAAPWLDLYFTERVQLWWVEPLGVTGVTVHTLGFRCGGEIGVLGETSFLWDPFQRFTGFQAAVAFYFSLSSTKAAMPRVAESKPLGEP